jgi:hypothetical protein
MAGDSDLLNRLVKVLGAFDDSALAALTSVGLVRRARKDLEKETVTVESQSTAIKIVVGDGTVSMTETGPADARCTCPAGAKCRHVLVAVLHLKEKLTLSSAPTAVEGNTRPELSAREELLALTEDELAKWVGRKTLRDAARLIAGASDIEVIEDTAVTVRFASSSIECRYFAGAGLTGMVTAAPSKLREQFMAAAVLAYRRHHGMVHAIEAIVPVSKTIDAPRTPEEILQSAISLLEEMITIGITHVSGSVRDRLQTLSVSCVGSNMPRLSLQLKSLADEVAMTLRRDAGADDVRMFNTMARTYALCSAISAAGDSPPLSLLGQSRSRYDHTGAMDLIGVGAYAWRTRSGYHGVTVLFWDATAKQFCSWSDSRPVSQDVSFSPVSRYEQDLPWQGSGSARMMSRSRFKLSGASRNEDHRLSGSEQCRAVILNDTDPASVDFGSRAFTDWNELRRYLASVTPAGLAEFSPLDRVVVLKPAAWGQRAFLSAEQTLVWVVLDDQGRPLLLTLPFDAVSERAVRLLETADPQSDPPSAIVGSVSFDGAQIRLYPYSLLRNTGTAPVQNLNLDALKIKDPTAAAPTKKTDAGTAGESATESMTAALAAVFAQWGELEDDLQRLAESGTRRMIANGQGTVKSKADGLINRGLGALAANLASGTDASDTARRALRLRYLCNLHRDLAIRSILSDRVE